LLIKGKRVLVTGGAGFLGSHLVDLLARHNRVTVLDDFSVGNDAHLGSTGPVRIIRADVCDRSSIVEAIQDAEVIFHLAAVCLRVSLGDPTRNQRVNDTGTLEVLLAARDVGVERFVYISSSEVYGTARWIPMDEDHPTLPTTPYGASKLAGEAMTFSFYHSYGLPSVIVRPFNAYGPRAHAEGPSGEVIPRFVQRALAGQPMVVFGDGLQTRDFTWVEDTVQGIVLAAECDQLVGDCVNIARGEEVSIVKLAQFINMLTGSSAPIVHRASRPGDVRRHYANVERGRDLLGFDAEVGIEEGLSRYIDWVKAQPGAGSFASSEGERNWEISTVTV
jgi:UDP-glucose 4-epimerase